MFRAWVMVCVVLSLWVGGAAAQSSDDRVWIQVQAVRSLSEAQQSAREYSQAFSDVSGFALGGGWYGIALGPYLQTEADSLLRAYRARRLIPQDSYVVFTQSFQRQFWPVGTNILTPGETPANPTPQPDVVEVVDEPEVVVPDETPREARASEARLTRDQKKELQVALRWAGYYSGAIDAAFGRGTRGAMAAFQTDNGFETTGVLTTAQRAELFRQYNAVLEGMDLRVVTDDRAGIAMKLPTGVVAFDKYEFPFSMYAARGDVGAQVLLISQRGNQTTLHGLYDIMETLEIVPLEGPRQKRRADFTLTGTNDTIVSHTEARLVRGEVKGFTLIWPAGDEERRRRVLEEMRASFKILPGATLSRSDTATEEQSLDLVSGLKLRRPKLSRSGFWTDRRGTVLTSTEGLGACTRITLDEEYEAEVTATDDALGVAVLRPKEQLTPPAVASFRRAEPRLKSEIAAAGFSYEGRLGAPTLTFGQVEDLQGLDGEEDLRRLSLATLPGDIGGPIFDRAGAVMGLLLPPDAGSKRLPGDVQFAAASDVLRALLSRAGADPGFTTSNGAMAPEDLTTLARDVVVLVSCWE